MYSLVLLYIIYYIIIIIIYYLLLLLCTVDNNGAVLVLLLYCIIIIIYYLLFIIITITYQRNTCNGTGTCKWTLIIMSIVIIIISWQRWHKDDVAIDIYGTWQYSCGYASPSSFQRLWYYCCFLLRVHHIICMCARGGRGCGRGRCCYNGGCICFSIRRLCLRIPLLECSIDHSLHSKTQ